MKKVVLIGGHPKGYAEPFHPKTKSGRVLHVIVDDLKIKPELFNLWKNEAGEQKREIGRTMRKKLLKYLTDGFLIVALGRYQEQVLVKNDIKCVFLPHPASRRAVDRGKLKSGLSGLFLLR